MSGEIKVNDVVHVRHFHVGLCSPVVKMRSSFFSNCIAATSA